MDWVGCSGLLEGFNQESAFEPTASRLQSERSKVPPTQVGFPRLRGGGTADLPAPTIFVIAVDL